MQKIMIVAALLALMTPAGNALAAPQTAPSPVPAQTTVSRQMPLPPGSAAPTREAQGIGRPLLYWGLGGAAIITSVILMSQSDHGATATTTTTSTTSTTSTH